QYVAGSNSLSPSPLSSSGRARGVLYNLSSKELIELITLFFHSWCNYFQSTINCHSDCSCNRLHTLMCFLLSVECRVDFRISIHTSDYYSFFFHFFARFNEVRIEFTIRNDLTQ